MICNMRDELSILRESSFEFHLTGSRFFGTATQGSDWDFFVQDSPEVQKWLISRNANQVKHPLYETPTSVWILNGIHIQLVEDVQAKIKAQNLILRWDLYKFDKPTMKKIWSALLEAVKNDKISTQDKLGLEILIGEWR